MEEQNPTPNEGGASTLDRIGAYLSGSQTQEQPAPQETPEPAEPAAQEAQTTVEPEDDGLEQTNEPQYTTSDLAKLLKLDDGSLDLDEEGNPVFKTKVDGKEGTAKLQDLLKSYQLQEHVDRRVREAAEREKALQTRQQEVEQQFAQRLQYAENLVNVAAQDLLRDFQSVNWQALEVQSPGEAALLRQKFQERQAMLRGVLQNVEANKALMTQNALAQRQHMLAQEAERLPQIIPEWKDHAVASKEKSDIREWALKNGFQAEEVDNFYLAHHVGVMRKAMLFDKLQSSKPQIENKVRTAPKLVKPGQAEAGDAKTQNIRNLKQQIVKSGGKRGIADYLIATGKV